MGKLSEKLKEANELAEFGDVLDQGEKRLRELEEMRLVSSFRKVIEMLECDDDDLEELISNDIDPAHNVIGGGISDLPIAEPLSKSQEMLRESAYDFCEIDESTGADECKHQEQVEQILASLENLF